MAPCAVPITFSRLWTARNDNVVRLRDTIHDVACDSHVITNLGASARANLVFPLPRHYFGINASDLDSCLQAFCKMLICDWTTNSNARPCASVVRALRGWLASIR